MQERMLVGLIGANIQKSLSPALFEDACVARGILGHYHLMDMDQLSGRSLADLLHAARVVGFKGVNITYPCKEAVIPLLDGLSPEARQIGAVNTVAIGTDGRTTGYNTDRIGFRRAFEQQLGAELVAGKAAMLVGAGGTGRAAAFALFDLGLRTLRVNDKDVEQARALVQTLAGMLGIPGNHIPLDPSAGTHWVADVIYTPLETRLFKTARSKGARVMGGAGMCVRQAAETFKLFTGLTADVGRMQRTFAEAAAVREKTLETAG